MSTFVWPNDEGWPYPDTAGETPDLAAETDEDLLEVTRDRAHLLDGLDTLEREVVAARFGLAGHRELTIRELVATTGVPRADLRDALGSGLRKLRVRLGA